MTRDWEGEAADGSRVRGTCLQPIIDYRYRFVSEALCLITAENTLREILTRRFGR